MASWTDNFNRAGPGLGANWGDSVGGDLQIVSSVQVTGVVAAADNSQRWTANTPTAAQYAQAVLKAAGASTFQGPLIRASATDWVILDADRSLNAFRLEWYNAGAFTLIGTAYSATPVANDVLKITADGSAFEGFVNGVLRTSGSNGSAPSSGQTGLYVFSNSATDTGLDDFEGGDLVQVSVRLGVFDPMLRDKAWYDETLLIEGWFDSDLIDAAAGGQIIAVGQAAETDSALALSILKQVGLGQVLETDLALAAAALRQIALGQASEADLALASSVLKAVLLGQALETDLALPAVASEGHPVGQAVEQDTAFGLTVLKNVLLGQVSEADSALVLSSLKVVLLGQASEVDIAQALSSLKRVLLGIAAEADQAIPLSGAMVIALGQATEVDQALPLIPPSQPAPPVSVSADKAAIFFGRRYHLPQEDPLELWIELFMTVLHLGRQQAEERARAQLQMYDQEAEELLYLL